MKVGNSSNMWIFRMVASSNIVLSNVQDFRFVTGSAGGADWVLYKRLVKLPKSDAKALYDSIVKTQALYDFLEKTEKNEKPADETPN